MTTRRKKRAVSALISFLFLCLALLPCAGCFASCLGEPVKEIRFLRSELSLDIGQTYSVTGSILEYVPATTSQKGYVLSSSDESVVVASDASFTAVGSGTAVVTATSAHNRDVSASITVNVSYAEPSTLEVEMTGKRAQYVGDVSPLTFVASTDVVLDPETRFEWYQGDILREGYTSATYSCYSTEAGEYSVSVKLSEYGLSATAVYRVFAGKIEGAEAVSSGELVQENGYTPVKVVSSWDAREGDPEPFIDYYVNGELFASGTDTFTFTPKTAGEYDITAYVNDEKIEIDGKDGITVVAKGSVVPTDLGVTFDNVYPNIIIEWRAPHTDGMNYGLKIVNLTTGRTDETFATTNASVRPYFDGTSFNAGAFLDLTENVYEISVRSLGDGQIYSPSDYCEPIRTEKIDKNALSYLESKVLGGAYDHYASSDEDLALLYSYYFAFRGKGDIDFTVYMGYTSKMTQSELSSYCFDYGSTVGLYSTVMRGSAEKGKTLRFAIECKNSVVPETYGSSTYEELGALEPHIAEEPNRGRNHVFATDNLPCGMSVSTSEELFRCIELGATPIPKSGSRAQTLYSYAKRLLINIISDDMSDVEKVHAIYDWIMWNVKYDREAAANRSAEESAKYSAYYLDGVLTDTNSYAVCDGIAKALSMLCRMEGIPAVRVTGRAGTSVAGKSYAEASRIKQDWGGHAWNKVFVGGAWYVVDATWGDAGKNINGRNFELAVHDYLLVSDADIANTHEYDSYVVNPDTAPLSYNIYANMEFDFEKNGKTKTVDCYIEYVGDEFDRELGDILSYLVSDARANTTYGFTTARFKPVTIGNRNVGRSYYGVEIASSLAARAALKEAAYSSVAVLGGRRSFKNSVIDETLSSYGYNSDDYMVIFRNHSIIVMLEPIMPA